MDGFCSHVGYSGLLPTVQPTWRFVAVSALSDLLNLHIAASETFRDMSNRKMAIEAGLSHGTVNTYRNGEHPNAPKEDVLQAFHELLSIPLADLREAAGVPLGEPEPYVAPAEFNRLSHSQRAALDEFVRSFLGPVGAEATPTAKTRTPRASRTTDRRSANKPQTTIAVRKPSVGNVPKEA